MRKLVLVFGIVCLLQAISAEPKPGFALTNTISGTSRITLVKDDAKLTVDAVKALTVPTIASGYAGLTATKTQIEKVITNFGVKGQNILNGYDTLVAATDGDVPGQFGAFINTIDEASNYITSEAPAITTALKDLTYTGISDELTDAFERINIALGELKSKTNSVQQGIQAAYNVDNSATASSDALRQHVPLRLMYDMLRAASILRAYLPLVKYILTSTIENIKLGDEYLTSLEDVLTNGVNTDLQKITDDIKDIVNKITKQVADDFKGDYVNAHATVEGVSALNNIKTATKYGELMTAMITLDGLFTVSSLSPQTSTMISAFDKISSSLNSRIAYFQSLVKISEFPIYMQLVDTLMGNDEYGRYCFNKYKELGINLFMDGLDSIWQCTDKEYERLTYLKETLNLLNEQIIYDYEDITDQTNTCDSLTTAANLNSCIDALANFYTQTFAATTEKIAVVFQFAADEAAASENRILICAQLVFLDKNVIEPEKLSTKLQKCSIAGPAGTEE